MGTSDNILFSSHYIFPILINSLKSAIIAINCTFFSIMAPDETWAVQLKIQTICINLCMPRKTSIIDWQSWFMFYCGYSFSVLWPHHMSDCWITLNLPANDAAEQPLRMFILRTIPMLNDLTRKNYIFYVLTRNMIS